MLRRFFNLLYGNMGIVLYLSANLGEGISNRSWVNLNSIGSKNKLEHKWRLPNSKRSVGSAEDSLGEEGPKDTAPKKKRTKKNADNKSKKEPASAKEHTSSESMGPIEGEQAFVKEPDQNSNDDDIVNDELYFKAWQYIYEKSMDLLGNIENVRKARKADKAKKAEQLRKEKIPPSEYLIRFLSSLSEDPLEKDPELEEQILKKVAEVAFFYLCISKKEPPTVEEEKQFRWNAIRLIEDIEYYNSIIKPEPYSKRKVWDYTQYLRDSKQVYMLNLICDYLLLHVKRIDEVCQQKDRKDSSQDQQETKGLIDPKDEDKSITKEGVPGKRKRKKGKKDENSDSDPKDENQSITKEGVPGKRKRKKGKKDENSDPGDEGGTPLPDSDLPLPGSDLPLPDSDLPLPGSDLPFDDLYPEDDFDDLYPEDDFNDPYPEDDFNDPYPEGDDDDRDPKGDDDDRGDSEGDDDDRGDSEGGIDYPYPEGDDDDQDPEGDFDDDQYYDRDFHDEDPDSDYRYIYFETEDNFHDNNIFLLKNRDDPFCQKFYSEQEEYWEQPKGYLIKRRKKGKENESQQNKSTKNNHEGNLNLDSDLNEEGTKNEEEYQNEEETQKYRHLWVQCENCYELNYKKYFFNTKLNICEHCGSYLKMSSSERIDLPIDPGTWNPMDENMISTDPIEFDRNPTKNENADPPPGIMCNDTKNGSDFNSTNQTDDINFESAESDEGNYKSESDEGNSQSESDEGNSQSEEDSKDCIDCGSESEEKNYKDRIDWYQEETGLTEAVQTGTGQLNGIPIAIGVMDFQFIGGSMGSVVGEKITRLIEYATKNSLPVILVCASGGARMQEGSLSLMQMAKISAALHKHQTNKKLFYISILTTPTTGGVTASFGMLGDIIIAEPNADIAFAGKRVIEQTLNLTVPEDLQTAETLFENGLLDLIIPRNLLKNLISEFLKLHDVNENQVEHK